MSDNSQIPAVGDLIATDELVTINSSAAVAGLKVQRAKIGYGDDGDFTDVSSTKPLPVVLDSVSLAALENINVAVSNPGLTDTQLRAAAVPVVSNTVYNVVSTNNSSTIQLAAGATFIGITETTQNQPNANILLTCDQPVLLVVYQYIDLAGTYSITPKSFIVPATQSFSYCLPINGKYVKFSATNQGTATSTTFNLNVTYGQTPSTDQAGNLPAALYGTGELSGVNLIEEVITGNNNLTLGVRVANQPKQDAIGALIASDAPPSQPYVLSGLNSVYILDTTGYNSLNLELTGTWVGTVTWTGSNDLQTWQGITAVASTAPSSLLSTTTINGQYILQCSSKYIRLQFTAYTSGQAIVVAYLRTASTTLATSNNISAIAGTAPVTAGIAGILAIGGNIAAGNAPTANPVLVAGVDTAGLTRRLQTDAQGNLFSAGIMPAGYQIGTYNVTYSSYTSTISSLTSTQSNISPVVVGGADQNNAIRRILTDQIGAAAITSAPATQAQQSIHDLLLQMVAAQRVANHYLYELYVASGIQRTAGDEPDMLQADYLEAANKFTNLVN